MNQGKTEQSTSRESWIKPTNQNERRNNRKRNRVRTSEPSNKDEVELLREEVAQLRETVLTLTNQLKSLLELQKLLQPNQSQTSSTESNQ